MGRTRAYTRILPFMSSIALNTRLRARASSCRPGHRSASSQPAFGTVKYSLLGCHQRSMQHAASLSSPGIQPR